MPTDLKEKAKMTVNMSSKTTVKNLITALLEMPMENEIEICVKNENGKIRYTNICSIYTDEYNGNNKVIIADWLI